MEGSPYVVQAIYSFKGKNNDELCFRKGDIITVTQMEEGGWWEGTLDGKTGWFPANYVQEYKQGGSSVQGDAHLSPGKGGTSPVSPTSPMQGITAQKAYRHVVLNDLVESERVHVGEMKTLLNTYLQPLQKMPPLNNEEYTHLLSNLPAVLEAHEQLLRGMEAELRVEERQDGGFARVGRLFLSSAPMLKNVHSTYCAGHPRAVCLLEKYRDDLGTYMENRGATPPGLLVLTTGLSRPFRRLDKYASMLQELERHLGEGHPDSGDTQRSVSVYGEVASGCCALRRQKELELEVLRGGIRGWEGEDLHTLGEILHMGSVAFGPDHRDRHLLLFPSTLLILSASQRMSAFIYEGKLPLSGITVIKLEDSEISKNAFEISGPMIERIVAQCQSKEDQGRWVSLLNQQINSVCKSSSSSGSGVSSPSTAPVLTTSPSVPSASSPTGSTKSQKPNSPAVGISNSTQAAKHVSPLRPPLPPRPSLPLNLKKVPVSPKQQRPPIPPKPTLSLALLRPPPSILLKASHHSDPVLPSMRSISEISDGRTNSTSSVDSNQEVAVSQDISRSSGMSPPSLQDRTRESASPSGDKDVVLSCANPANSRVNSSNGIRAYVGHNSISCSTPASSREPSSKLPSLIELHCSSSSASSVIASIHDSDTESQECLQTENHSRNSNNEEDISPDPKCSSFLSEDRSQVSTNPKNVTNQPESLPASLDQSKATVLDSDYRPPRPYSQLAAHFADLLHRHVITSEMLKHLLYKEYGMVVGTDSVALRIRPSEIIATAEPDENETSEAMVRKVFLPRQDAVDVEKEEDDDKSVYSGDEFVRYFDGSDVEEVYLESESDESDGHFEEPLVEVEAEEEIDGWRNVATQTDPALYCSQLYDLEEEECDEDDMLHEEPCMDSDGEVKEDAEPEMAHRESCGTDSDGWTYMDYQAHENSNSKIESSQMFGSMAMHPKIQDLREAGRSDSKDKSYTLGKRFATGRKRKGLEEDKRHSVPASLLPCLSRDPAGRSRCYDLDSTQQYRMEEGTTDLKDTNCDARMENADEKDIVDGCEEEAKPKASKKCVFKGKKKGKRGKKGQDKETEDDFTVGFAISHDGRVSPAHGHTRRKGNTRKKEYKDEWVSVGNNDPFLEPALGAESTFCTSTLGEGRGEGFEHIIGNSSMLEKDNFSTMDKNGFLMGKIGCVPKSKSDSNKTSSDGGTGHGNERGSCCVVGVHSAGCRLVGAEGAQEVPCPCQWVDFPSRRSSDSGLADVCCTGAQVDSGQRKKQRQGTPPSQKGDDGCHDCEERTASVSTSPISPLVSPLPAEDGVGSEGEATPWWESVRLTAQALGVSAEALKLSAEALKVSAEAMGFLGDQGAGGRRMAGFNARGLGRSRPPSPGGPSSPTSS